jgi:hypothetical protein
MNFLSTDNEKAAYIVGVFVGAAIAIGLLEWLHEKEVRRIEYERERNTDRDSRVIDGTAVERRDEEFRDRTGYGHGV